MNPPDFDWRALQQALLRTSDRLKPWQLRWVIALGQHRPPKPEDLATLRQLALQAGVAP